MDVILNQTANLILLNLYLQYIHDPSVSNPMLMVNTSESAPSNGLHVLLCFMVTVQYVRVISLLIELSLAD